MCYKPAETLRGEVSWCLHLTFKWFKERKKKVYMERERERQMLTTNDIRWKKREKIEIHGQHGDWGYAMFYLSLLTQFLLIRTIRIVLHLWARRARVRPVQQYFKTSLFNLWILSHTSWVLLTQPFHPHQHTSMFWKHPS